jgi:hypothetical protein
VWDDRILDERSYRAFLEIAQRRVTNDVVRAGLGTRPHPAELFSVVAEGCVDFICGRPRSRSPYDPATARDAHEAWLFGWDDAQLLFETRAAKEATRWLEAA